MIALPLIFKPHISTRPAISTENGTISLPGQRLSVAAHKGDDPEPLVNIICRCLHGYSVGLNNAVGHWLGVVIELSSRPQDTCSVIDRPCADVGVEIPVVVSQAPSGLGTLRLDSIALLSVRVLDPLQCCILELLGRRGAGRGGPGAGGGGRRL